MKKEIVVPPSQAKLALPFSPAVKANGFVFVSGIGSTRESETGAKLENIEAQTRQTLKDIKAVLEAAGSSLEKVVKVTVFLRNAEDFAKMNEAYKTFFPADLPARSTIITNLVFRSMLIEIECVALQ